MTPADEDINRKILFNRLHSDEPLSTTMLGLVLLQGDPPYVPFAGDGDNHLLPGNQVLVFKVVHVLCYLGPPQVTIFLFEFPQLILDYVVDLLITCQDFCQFIDDLHEPGMLVLYGLHLEPCKFLELLLEDGLGLYLGDGEPQNEVLTRFSGRR